MKRFWRGGALLLAALLSLAYTMNSVEQAHSAARETLHQPRDAAALYAKHCASCHGKDGRGKTFKAKFNHARNLADRDWQEQVSDERIFNSIMNGRGKKMPAFGKKLSDEEMNAMVEYVRRLRQ